MPTIPTAPKYPDISVQLTGYSDPRARRIALWQNDNAHLILMRVKKALLTHGVDNEVVKQFMYEATGGDYDHLLHTCLEWVDVS